MFLKELLKLATTKSQFAAMGLWERCTCSNIRQFENISTSGTNLYLHTSYIKWQDLFSSFIPHFPTLAHTYIFVPHLHKCGTFSHFHIWSTFFQVVLPLPVSAADLLLEQAWTCLNRVIALTYHQLVHGIGAVVHWMEWWGWTGWNQSGVMVFIISHASYSFLQLGTIPIW